MNPVSYPARPALLIATLGSEPQVVTAALDLLLSQGERIERVVVLHTDAPGTPVAAALARLQEAFAAQPQDGQAALELQVLRAAGGAALNDVDSPAAAEAAFRQLYRLVWVNKRAGVRVHLSIAGGRKSLAVFGMAVAQLLFDEDDRLWHLFSAGEFLASKRLHPGPGDQARLIAIPFLPWSRVSPVVGALSEVEDPYAAVERARALQLAERLELARTFALGSLTPAELRVVELLVRAGLPDDELAERLSLSKRTVENHLRAAYRKAAYHWALADVGRAQLVGLLSLYFSLQGSGQGEG